MRKDQKDVSIKDLKITISNYNGKYYFSCKQLGVISERLLVKTFKRAKLVTFESVLHLISGSSKHNGKKEELIRQIRELSYQDN